MNLQFWIMLASTVTGGSLVGLEILDDDPQVAAQAAISTLGPEVETAVAALQALDELQRELERQNHVAPHGTWHNSHYSHKYQSHQLTGLHQSNDPLRSWDTRAGWDTPQTYVSSSAYNPLQQWQQGNLYTPGSLSSWNGW